MSEEISIPAGSFVSFIDPLNQLPVKGVVMLEFPAYLGVRYMRKLKGANEEVPVWINISKDRVFIVKR